MPPRTRGTTRTRREPAATLETIEAPPPVPTSVDPFAPPSDFEDGTGMPPAGTEYQPSEELLAKWANRGPAGMPSSVNAEETPAAALQRAAGRIIELEAERDALREQADRQLTAMGEMSTELEQARKVIAGLTEANDTLTKALVTADVAGPAPMCSIHFPEGWDGLAKAITGATCEHAPDGGWTRPEILAAERERVAADRAAGIASPAPVSPAEARFAGAIDSDDIFG